jgi:hypothetical protein
VILLRDDGDLDFAANIVVVAMERIGGDEREGKLIEMMWITHANIVFPRLLVS